MEMILEHGAEVDILDSGGLTPLHFAARFKINQESGDVGRVVSTYKPAIMEDKDEVDQVDPAIHLLVQYGAEVNKKDRYSNRTIRFAKIIAFNIYQIWVDTSSLRCYERQHGGTPTACQVSCHRCRCW